jgi:hypothetical protein
MRGKFALTSAQIHQLGRAITIKFNILGAFWSHKPLRCAPLNANPHIDESGSYTVFDHMVKIQAVCPLAVRYISQSNGWCNT